MNTRPSYFLYSRRILKRGEIPLTAKHTPQSATSVTFCEIVSKKSNISLTFKYFYGKLLGVFDYPDKDSLVTVRKGIRING